MLSNGMSVCFNLQPTDCPSYKKILPLIIHPSTIICSIILRSKQFNTQTRTQTSLSTCRIPLYTTRTCKPAISTICGFNRRSKCIIAARAQTPRTTQCFFRSRLAEIIANYPVEGDPPCSSVLSTWKVHKSLLQTSQSLRYSVLYSRVAKRVNSSSSYSSISSPASRVVLAYSRVVRNSPSYLPPYD